MLQIATWKRILILGIAALFVAYSLPNLFYGRVETHNDAITQIERQGETPERLAAKAGWPDWAPSGLVNLGLDLRGGAHLLAEVHLSEVYSDRMDGYWPDVRDALRDVREQVGTIRRQPSDSGTLVVRISNPEAMAAAPEPVLPVMPATNRRGSTSPSFKSGTLASSTALAKQPGCATCGVVTLGRCSGSAHVNSRKRAAAPWACLYTAS
jgi:preprotein translocase subunit SecD